MRALPLVPRERRTGASARCPTWGACGTASREDDSYRCCRFSRRSSGHAMREASSAHGSAAAAAMHAAHHLRKRSGARLEVIVGGVVHRRRFSWSVLVAFDAGRHQRLDLVVWINLRRVVVFKLRNLRRPPRRQSNKYCLSSSSSPATKCSRYIVNPSKSNTSHSAYRSDLTNPSYPCSR